MHLEDLREKLKTFASKQSLERIPTALVSGGIPRGVLAQVSGVSSREWLARLLSENPKINIAWLESKMRVFPTGLHQRKVGLSRILFTEAEENTDWVLTHVLKSGLFPIVICPRDFRGTSQDDKTLRRFQILAEQSGSTVFFLTDTHFSTWIIKLHIQCDGKQPAKILKQKTGS